MCVGTCVSADEHEALVIYKITLNMGKHVQITIIKFKHLIKNKNI